MVFVMLCLVVGIVMQAALFKNDSNTWIEAMKTWPALWVVYFGLSHVLTEHIFRAIKTRKTMSQ